MWLHIPQEIQMVSCFFSTQYVTYWYKNTNASITQHYIFTCKIRYRCNIAVATIYK